jgi:type I restriction enzyme S subunit
MIEAQLANKNKRPLPEGWRWVKLGDVCDRIRNGTTANQFQDIEGIPVTRIESISSGDINPNKVGFLSGSIDDYCDYLLEPGDVLFSHINCVERLGNCALYEGMPVNLIHGMNLLRMAPNRKLVFPEFLLWCLRSEAAIVFYRENARRAIGQASLNTKDIIALPLALPPLPEQHRIAEILREQMASVEKARAAAEARLKAVKALPAAFLRRVFPQHGQSLPAGWRWVKLGDVCEGSGQYGTSRKSNNMEKGIPILGMYQIHEGRIRWKNISYIELEQNELSKYLLNHGDLLFNRTNSAELVGKTAVYDLNSAAVFASYLIRFRLLLLRADPYFVSIYINSQDGRRFIEKKMVRAIGQVNISASIMREMPIPIPDISLQRKIAGLLMEQIAVVEKIRNAAEEELKTINTIPAALLQTRADSELSWTVDMDERKRIASEEAQPLKDQSTTKSRQAAQWNEKLKELKKAKPQDDKAIEEAEASFKELTREARDFAAKAKEMEDAVYDLKAVNPNKKPDIDTRTPEELMDIIETKGREIHEALAALRAL